MVGPDQSAPELKLCDNPVKNLPNDEVYGQILARDERVKGIVPSLSSKGGIH